MNRTLRCTLAILAVALCVASAVQAQVITANTYSTLTVTNTPVVIVSAPTGKVIYDATIRVRSGAIYLANTAGAATAGVARVIAGSGDTLPKEFGKGLANNVPIYGVSTGGTASVEVILQSK